MKTFFTVVTLLLSFNVAATQDYEDPQQILQLLRLFLSDPVVAKDVDKYAAAGCVWKSETIWTGGGGQPLEEGGYAYGGGFDIYYSTRSGNEIHSSYWYSIKVHEETRSLIEITKREKGRTEIDCS